MAKKLADSIVLEESTPSVCSREFTFTVPADAVRAESDRVSGYIAGMVQLPGFRPGKAPVAMVAGKYAKEIEDELKNRIFQTAVGKIDAEKLDLLSLSFKEEPSFKAGEEFKFVFAADVAPAIELGDYNALKIDLPVEAVEDKAVEERLEMYRAMYGTYAAVDAPAEAGDMIKADYKSDFELPEDADASLKRQVAAENAFLWLSEPEIIPGSIAALTGAEKGKEYTFDATYPADYRDAKLAGKTLKYTVKVQEVQRRGKLDDAELIQRTRSESIDALRATIRQGLEGEAKAKRREAAGEEITKQLLEKAGDFELPPALLANEVQRELQKIARESVKSEEDAEKFKSELEAHRKEAEAAAAKSLRRSLILRQIAKQEKITVAESELENQMQGMSRYYGYRPKEMRSMLEKSGAIDDLRIDMVNAKVLERLVDAALK